MLLFIAVTLTPSSMAAAVFDTYSTVSPVSMFFTSTACERAILAAATHSGARAASRLDRSQLFLIFSKAASEC
jgi:hypothetical protein